MENPNKVFICDNCNKKLSSRIDPERKGPDHIMMRYRIALAKKDCDVCHHWKLQTIENKTVHFCDMDCLKEYFTQKNKRPKLKP